MCFANFTHEQRGGLQNVLISTKVINVRFCSIYKINRLFSKKTHPFKKKSEMRIIEFYIV